MVIGIGLLELADEEKASTKKPIPLPPPNDEMNPLLLNTKDTKQHQIATATDFNNIIVDSFWIRNNSDEPVEDDALKVASFRQ